MALLCPREGNVQLLTDLLGAGENWLLRLYHSNITPSETDTGSTYTAQEAIFTGYAAKTLTRTIGTSNWNTPINAAPTGWTPFGTHTQVGRSQYGAAAQAWTCGATGDTIYGYFITGVTSSKLICAEKFGTARTLANTDVLNLQPMMELA